MIDQSRIVIIRKAFGISQERMARLLNVSTRTVERWEERNTLPVGPIRRSHLAKLQDIVDLGIVVYGSEAFQKFMSLPMPLFGGRTALHLMEQGEADRVYGTLAADYEGQGY